jgi:hypothetical protein
MWCPWEVRVDSVEVRELQEELSKLRGLVLHAGYDYLVKIAQAQLETRRQQIILTPLKSMDEVLAQEFAKGETAGIELFTRLVDIRINYLESEINERLKENGDESE